MATRMPALWRRGQHPGLQADEALTSARMLGDVKALLMIVLVGPFGEGRGPMMPRIEVEPPGFNEFEAP
jgi:hypothetical protein